MMIKFDLEKALAGDKVVTRDGREVTQLHYFKGVDVGRECIYGFLDGDVREYFDGGVYNVESNENANDLFMAPKQLSGFVNVYNNGRTGFINDTRKDCNETCREGRIACIDLSQFDEGHGL